MLRNRAGGGGEGVVKIIYQTYFKKKHKYIKKFKLRWGKGPPLPLLFHCKDPILDSTEMAINKGYTFERKFFVYCNRDK